MRLNVPQRSATTFSFNHPAEMQDPFAPNTNSQLMREAQIGLLLVTLLLGVFVYLAYYRITGQGRQLPEHVRLAPVAQAVWPNSQPPETHQQYAATEQKSALPDESWAPAKVYADPSVARVKFEDKTVPVPVVKRIPAPKPPAIIKAAEPKIAARPKTTRPMFQANPQLEEPLPKPTLPKIAAPKAAAWPNRPKTTPSLAQDFKPTPKRQFPDDKNNFRPLRPKQQPADFQSNSFAPRPQPKQAKRPVVQPVRPIVKTIAAPKPNSVKTTNPKNPPVDIARAALAPPKVKAAVKPAKALPKVLRVSDQQKFHTSAEGDTFWSIATAVYGDGRYFGALYQYNEPYVPDYNSIAPGTKIAIPPPRDLRNLWPDLCPSEETGKVDHELVAYDQSLSDRLYVTRKNDTLFEIARQKLGQASRYFEILSLNDLKLPADVQHLSPLPGGLKLVLPEQ